ncbi:MAG TPA: hypothetical protein VK901_13650 [Nitrospiraceae bacterium]|nr:hypothetical protein [Nitrospiraceae bacterium]
MMSLRYLLKSVVVCCLMLAIGAPLSAQAQHFHELDKNFCILKFGPYGMHLTEYQPDTSAQRELFGDVPSTGRTVLVLDFIEGELRSLPVEVRVIKDTGSEQDLQAITVLHVPAKVYPGGFINFEHSFSQPGKFIGVVTVGGKEQHVARFPISVGESGVVSHFMHYIMVIVPLVAIAGGAAIFFFMRGRRKSPVSTVS